jgi:hypothetical protein
VRTLRLVKQKSGLTALLAVLVATAANGTTPAYAELGDQKVVKEVNAASGWTSIVPMNLNNDGLTDLLSYNATTGQAVYSIATSTPGEQKVVKQVNAAKGWTSIVPMALDASASTGLLSYNATTGQAVYSATTSGLGDQKIIREVNAAKGWTSIVPIFLEPSKILTDLLSYNAATGVAAYSIASGAPGDQSIVKQVNAAKGWTSIVPMEMNGDGVTDLLSYNIATGQAVYSTGWFGLSGGPH